MNDSPESEDRSPKSGPETGDRGPEETGGRVKKRDGIVRWSGFVPLALVVVLVVVVWIAFGNRLVQGVIAEVATKALGTEVDVRGFDLRLTAARVTIAQIEIADPFDVNRNVLDLGSIDVQLEVAPLLEKKVVVSLFTVGASRYHGARVTPARPVPKTGSSVARDVMGQVEKFAAQLSTPALKLGHIDTLQKLALDPAQLGTIKEAVALQGRADSVQKALTQGYADLRLEQRLDSATQLVDRLRGASLPSLGIGGVQKAVSDLRAAIASIDDARARAEKLATGTQQAGALLQRGVGDLDAARQKDYAFAKGLLKLPTIEGPQLGNAMFGKVSVDRFQQAVYYAELAKQYVPPGLMPKPEPGPKRLRAAGQTVAFPKEKQFPKLLLRRGEIAFAMTEGTSPVQYAVTMKDATTEPALVGAPMTLTASRTGQGTDFGAVRLGAVLDHRGPVGRDSAAGMANGIALTRFDFPGLPIAADLGTGDATFAFSKTGDALSGRWTLFANTVTWHVDSARASGMSDMERYATRIIEGVRGVSVTADLSGTLAAPKLAVKSNIDSIFAARLREMLGEEYKKAEAKARAEVDRLVAGQTQAARARVDAVQAGATKRVADVRAKLDARKKELEDRLKGMGGGLLRLPGD